MRYGDFIVQAPLIFGGQVCEAEVLGASVWLWMHSSMHRDAPLYALPTVLVPIIKRRQYVLVSERERPVFFLSWMWLNEDAEQRYLKEATVMIKDEDWCCGERMWFRDFIAPFGHTHAMSRLLREEILPHHCARFLWHRGETIRPCIKTFRGNHVPRDEFQAWKLLSPPQTRLQGSHIVADNDVHLKAGNNLTITTAEERGSESHQKQEKKSGLSGTGGIGMTYGTQELKVTDTAQNVTHQGSTVGSVNGSVILSAGNDLNVHASDVIAGNDMTLAGKNVSVTSATESSRQTHEVEQKSSGFTLALSGAAGSAINSAVQSANQAKESDNDRLAALQGVKAALSGVQASQAVRMDEAQGDRASNNNTVGVSLSYGSQSSKSTQDSEQTTSKGSSLNAGNNLTVVATGSGQKGQDGDILIQGSQASAGNDVLLSANRDVNLISAENTSKLDGKNESRGGSVGVGIGAGSGGWGINVSASVNAGKGSEKGNGTTHTETTVNADNNLTINSGRDANLIGAQVSGESVMADIGRDLTIRSEQDSDSYHSKQQNVSAGGSFNFGSMSGSASINASRDKMDSNYQSVNEQSGITAGSGGFDINVGGHIQLDGAVIASSADEAKNRLETGTLGWSDIHNKAEYRVEHQSVGMSTGGSTGGQFTGNLANSMLSGVNSSGSAEGTTSSAISGGTLIIRDKESQQQSVDALSRDTANANGSIGQIFDKEKEQQKIQEAQLISDIGTQVSDIARTEDAIAAAQKASEKRQNATQDERDAAKAEWEKAHPGKTATEADIGEVIYQHAYTNAMKDAGNGTGSRTQQAIQAVTAAVQGVAGGNLNAAIAGAAAPYVAEAIGHHSGPRDDDKAAKIAAHAVANAVLASMQGQNALAGAAGAATGELAGMIALEMYNKPAAELSETEKQTVSSLATIAAGIAGGLAGDSTSSALTGAQGGKTTVENNLFGGNEEMQAKAARDHGADVASCSDDPGGTACQRGIAQNKAYAGALATGGVALLPGGAKAMWALGASANAGMQYADSGEINPVNSVVAGWINVITIGQGWKGTVAWNAAGGALTNAINGDDPLTGAITNGAGAGFGYGVGNYAVKPAANTTGKWITGGWNPKFDPTLLKYTEVKGQLGLSKEMVPSKIPSAVGNAGGSLSSEFGSSIIQKKKDVMEVGK